MAISVESTSTRILVTINDDGVFYLQREKSQNVRKWLTYTSNGFVDLSDPEETAIPLEVHPGDFVDSFDLVDGMYQYRYISTEIEEPQGQDYTYSKWIKYGNPDAIGYSFNNYHAPEGKWGTVVTPDDCRYTYLWGTDFKATNGTYFTDEQIQWFIDAATAEVERQLNLNIVKKTYKCTDSIQNQKKGVDYDEEESPYDFSYRKIQRYGMIQTKHRPIINVTKCTLINMGKNKDLLPSVVLDKKNGLIKFLDRGYIPNDTKRNINSAVGSYGSETIRNHLFYSVDYTAGLESSDDVPQDLRQIIGKVAAISLLNVIGDGLMSGFSSSSLSMDGISESFSSTQSATSAYFGARIAVYQKEVQEYINANKYKFGYFPMGCI